MLKDTRQHIHTRTRAWWLLRPPLPALTLPSISLGILTITANVAGTIWWTLSLSGDDLTGAQIKAHAGSPLLFGSFAAVAGVNISALGLGALLGTLHVALEDDQGNITGDTKLTVL